MPYIVDESKCEGCGDCVETCPNESIAMGENGKAVIDPDECLDCGSCEGACPEEAISYVD